MAIKEELIISARAETSKAEDGLRKIADEAEKLAGVQDQLADSTKGVAGETDKAAAATDAAAKAMAESTAKIEAMAAEIERLKQQMKDTESETRKQSKATDDAGDKFTEAAGKARKLTEQLREVGDEADVAAGQLVEKFGGAGAIKSLANVGIAFAGIKEGVEMFNDSAEKMFRGFGEDGQKVWDNVERSLFKIKGAFAETIIGTDDMYEAGARVKVAYEGVYEAFKAVIAPIGWIKDALAAVIPFEQLYADEIDSANEALKRKVAIEKAGIDPVTQRTQADLDAAKALKALYEQIDPYIKTQEQRLRLERENKIAIIETGRAEVEQQLNRTLTAAASVKADQERADIRKQVLREIRDRAEDEFAFADNAQQLIQRELDKAEESGEVYRKVTDRMIVRVAQIKSAINQDWSIAPALRVALLDADQAIAAARAKNTTENMGDLMFGTDSTSRASTAGRTIGTSFRDGVTSALTEDDGKPKDNFISNLLGLAHDVEGPISQLIDSFYTDFDHLMMARAPKMTFMERLNLEPKQEVNVDLKVEGLNRLIEAGEKANGIVKKVDDSMDQLAKTAKDIALDQLAKVPTELARAWGAAKATGEDAASAIGDAAKGLIAQMASEWGSFFVKQGIAMFFTNPAVGAGLIAAGTALSALAGFVGAEPAPSQATDETEAETINSNAVTSTRIGQQSFGYFEGGRSPVTIVTNDAASIRAMQSRLSLVAARGGSGV